MFFEPLKKKATALFIFSPFPANQGSGKKYFVSSPVDNWLKTKMNFLVSESHW